MSANTLPYISPYYTYDEQARQTTTSQFNNYYQLNNDNKLDESLIYDLDNQSFPGHTKDQMSMLEGKFSDLQKQYTDQTNDMRIVNDLVNVSGFMNSSMETEYNRISKLRDKTVSNVHKLRHHFMMLKYDTNYNIFVSGIVQYTLFVMVICGLLISLNLRPKGEKLGKTFTAWLIGIILFIYLVLVVIFIRQSFKRRKDDWNKYYFGSMDSSSKAQCDFILS